MAIDRSLARSERVLSSAADLYRLPATRHRCSHPRARCRRSLLSSSRSLNNPMLNDFFHNWHGTTLAVEWFKALRVYASTLPGTQAGGGKSETKSENTARRIEGIFSLPTPANCALCPAAVLPVPGLASQLSEIATSTFPAPNLQLDDLAVGTRAHLSALPLILNLSENNAISTPQHEKYSEECMARTSDVFRSFFRHIFNMSFYFAPTPSKTIADKSVHLFPDRELIVEDVLRELAELKTGHKDALGALNGWENLALSTASVLHPPV